MAKFVAPFPKDSLANAMGNGISGFMGGFISAYVTIKSVAKASAMAKRPRNPRLQNNNMLSKRLQK
jgi:hypothetical protein